MDFFAEQPDTEDRYWLLIFLGELLSEAGSIFLIYTLITINIQAPESCLQTLHRSFWPGTSIEISYQSIIHNLFGKQCRPRSDCS